MALAAMMLQAAPALADPPAHSQGWKNGKAHVEKNRHYDDRGQGWRGGDERYDDRRHYDQRYDDRRDYDRHRYQERYYPRHGYVVPRLPHGHRVVHYHGDRYYYGDGAWYRPYGAQFMIVAPPVGLMVSFLPEVQATLFFGGIPYYQSGPVYYVRHPRHGGYMVAQPPW
jgi:hypothetical protein